MEHLTYYRTIPADGFSIFYRGVGSPDAPKLLLLHGLSSSSQMFEPLFARVADQFHLVAPDYPEVGHNLPQEAPRAFAQAVLDVDRR